MEGIEQEFKSQCRLTFKFYINSRFQTYQNGDLKILRESIVTRT